MNISRINKFIIYKFTFIISRTHRIKSNLKRYISLVKATVYRVNAYDINSGNYMVLKSLEGHSYDLGAPIRYFRINNPLDENAYSVTQMNGE